MIIYMSKSKKFIECVEIHANTIDCGKSHIDYVDIIATLTNGQTMQLTPRGTVRFVGGIGSGHYEKEVDDNDKMTNKESPSEINFLVNSFSFNFILPIIS